MKQSPICMGSILSLFRTSNNVASASYGKVITELLDGDEFGAFSLNLP